MKSKLFHVLTASCLLSSIACAENMIQLKPDSSKPQEVLISPIQGSAHSLSFYRALWQAMKIKTTEGKNVNLTDLLFYRTCRDDKPAGQDGYWTKPENWDNQLTFKALEKNNNGGETVLIEGKRDGYTKQVYLTAYPNEKAVYVLNRLVVDAPGKYDDRQLIYMNTNPQHPASLSEIVLDGKALPLDKPNVANSSAVLYFEKSNATVVIFMAPASMQKHKLGKRGSFLFFEPVPPVACQLKLGGVTGQNLKVGDIIELCYVICWDDGMKIKEYSEFEKKIQNGECENRFYKIIKFQPK